MIENDLEGDVPMLEPISSDEGGAAGGTTEKRRFGDDYRNAFVKHQFAMQMFAAGFLTTEEEREVFVRQLSEPIVGFEEEVRKLRSGYREHAKQEDPGMTTTEIVQKEPELATGPINLRKEEVVKAARINSAAVAADEARKKFLEHFLKEPSSEETKNVAASFNEKLAELDRIATLD